MDYTKLDRFSFVYLKEIAAEMGLKSRRKKQDTMDVIIEGLKEYEDYKRDKIDRYERVKQIGNKGKEGVTYLVQTKDGAEYAMKCFRKQKSSTTLRKEAQLQKQAAKYGIAPDVVDVDTVSKYIVMEKMDRHLYEMMKKQDGDLKKSQQQAIIKIYKKLDEACVFHADSNILNYMYKGRQLYIIDFGMAKEITPAIQKKLGTNTPNMSMMLVGLIIKLKELRCPETAYQYLLSHLTSAEKAKFGL